MTRSRAILLALLLAVAGATAPAQHPHSRSRQDHLAGQIDALVRPLIENEIAVGLVVGVLKEGHATVRGYGRVDKDKPAAPNGDTVYEIGSITKVFTGILLADAIARRLVALNDPVQKHLPAAVKVPRHESQPVRLVHLTTHTSGLPRMPVNFHPANPRNPYADYTQKLLYEGLPKTTLKRAPGKQYEYSNLAVGLLGHVLARVDNRSSYEVLLRERITRPLALEDTRITLTEAMRKRLAPPYAAGGERRLNWDLNVLAGAGAIRSTVNDLLRFAGHNLTNVPPALRTAQTPYHDPGFVKRVQGALPIGLGWHMGRLPDTVWHNGGTGGYRSYLAIHLKKKYAVAVLANTTSKKIDELANKVFLAVLGRKVAPIRVRKAISVDADLLERYVGEYRLTATAKFTITRHGNALFARLTGQQAARIFPASKVHFFYR
ncbi:MAG: serine hydrolase, partial [Planctomycetota bacterium]